MYVCMYVCMYVIFDDVANSHSQMLQGAGSIVATAGEASDHIILIKLHRYNWLRIQKMSIRHQIILSIDTSYLANNIPKRIQSLSITPGPIICPHHQQLG